MTPSTKIRQQLASFLTWSDAHASFEDAVADLPVKARGQVPKGLSHSAWQLVEHMRLAQADILEFCVSQRYREKHFPVDYWPTSATPPNNRAWASSIARFKKDRRALEQLATNPARDLLANVPGGTGQTFLREIILAADHTAYHVGQLILVRRLLGHWG